MVLFYKNHLYGLLSIAFFVFTLSHSAEVVSKKPSAKELVERTIAEVEYDDVRVVVTDNYKNDVGKYGIGFVAYSVDTNRDIGRTFIQDLGNGVYYLDTLYIDPWARGEQPYIPLMTELFKYLVEHCAIKVFGNPHPWLERDPEKFEQMKQRLIKFYSGFGEVAVGMLGAHSYVVEPETENPKYSHRITIYLQDPKKVVKCKAPEKTKKSKKITSKL